MISAYKDPVEKQNVKKILDKIITLVFVIILGTVWYYSKRYYVKPDQYTIMIRDIFGKQVKTEEMQTEFKTQAIAHSFVLEYQRRFQQYDFSMTVEIPEFKRSKFWNVF